MYWTVDLLISFLVWCLPISPFLSIWSASVSLLNYLPDTINLQKLRGGKNLTSKAVLNLRHPELLSHITQKIQSPENSWWSNGQRNLENFLDTQGVGCFWLFYFCFVLFYLFVSLFVFLIFLFLGNYIFSICPGN